MAGEHHLASSELPDVEIVDLLNTWAGLEVSLEGVQVDVRWDGFHNDVHALFHDRGRGEKDDDREHEGADWIDDLPCGLPEDDPGGDDDSD